MGSIGGFTAGVTGSLYLSQEPRRLRGPPACGIESLPERIGLVKQLACLTKPALCETNLSKTLERICARRCNGPLPVGEDAQCRFERYSRPIAIARRKTLGTGLGQGLRPFERDVDRLLHRSGRMIVLHRQRPVEILKGFGVMPLVCAKNAELAQHSHAVSL